MDKNRVRFIFAVSIATNGVQSLFSDSGPCFSRAGSAEHIDELTL